MISINELNKKFGSLQVLNGINLSIDDGLVYGLVGESGQGKSTLLRCVNGLTPYDSGSLKVDGIEVKTKKNKELRMFRKNIGMIFQNFSLLERLTVFDNIAFPMRLWNYSEEEVKKQVKTMMEIVDLSNKENAYPSELSGGQKQRVAIARALVMNPKYLLSDEATSALDPGTSQSILSLLKQINDEFGITILLVTHQMDVVMQVCDRMALLKGGSIEIDGEVKDVFLKPHPYLNKLMGRNLAQISPSMEGIRVCIQDNQYQTFFNDIASATGIQCRYLEGGVEKYKNGNYFIGTIEVPKAKRSSIETFMNDKDIKYWVIENEI